MTHLVEVTDLVKHFPVRSGFVFKHKIGAVKAVDGVSFHLDAGETLALVGESGCGKSTTARALLRLVEPDSGSIRFNGEEITTLNHGRMRQLRREMQIVFQDPFASLNGRMRIRTILSEPFKIHGLDSTGKVPLFLDRVGLAAEHASRYPHEFSGGQRQRIGIARAIALEPKLVICDEPVSALDVSIQAQVLNLLQDLQVEFNLAYVLIAHDLSVVRQMAERVAVMYLGKIVEVGDAEAVYTKAGHPYSQALLSAVPVPDPRVERKRKRIVLTGDIPSALNPPSGCRFRTRCWKAQDICAVEEPALIDRGQGHPVACHFAGTEEVL